MRASILRRVSLLAMAASTVLATSVTPLTAQDCLQWVPPLLHDTSGDPEGTPSNPRILSTDIMYWNGAPYLVANQGNNLDMWRVSDPQNPGPKMESYFRAGTFGDRDYNLYNFSVCDDCQFGVASFEVLGTVFFSLGTGQTPAFQSNPRQYTTAQSKGAFTFKHNGQQYVLINGMPNGDPGSPAPANLFLLNGIETSQMINLGRVDVDGSVITVQGGYYINSASGAFIYVFDYPSLEGHIFKLIGTGTNLSLQYMGSPFVAPFVRSLGFRVDAGGTYAAAVLGTTATIYDISVPDQPAVLAQWTPDPLNPMQSVAIGYPFLWMARAGATASRTYDITNPSAPLQLDQGFWDPSNDWNAYGSLLDYDAVFSPDSSTLYDGRYSVLEMFSFAACGDATPIANLTLSPQPAFPGDTVTVTNTSVGGWTRSAVWVTDSTGAIKAGSPTLSASTPTTLNYVVPVDVGTGEAYTAHVAVENDDHPFVPSAPGEQLKNVAIGIDRTPTASITISPESVLTGETVTLTAIAEGHPLTDGGYSWHITPPSPGQAFDRSGQSTQVALDLSGTWNFELTVHYQHTAVGGGLYQYLTAKQLTVTSVAAAFVVTPSILLNTQPITLNAGTSRGPEGVTLGYDWSVTGPTPYSSCPNAVQCVIPGDALDPGQYQIGLTVTNPQNQDQSTAQKNVNVADGSVNPDFYWAPTNPEIGVSVTFSITGVDPEIEQATWNFGASGCSGYTQTTVCTPSLFNDCKSIAYKYASGGSKTVTLTVKVNGQNFTATPKTITVQNTGSCSGGGSCSYHLSATQTSFGAGGGSGVVSVSTTAGCPWQATKSVSWISLTGNTSGSGSGSVPFSVASNSGSARSGQITAGGASVPISQSGAGGGGADFSVSPTNPKIGDLVTLTVVGSSTPKYWALGGVDCDGNDPSVSCLFNPNLCKQITWRYQSAGVKTIVYTDDGNNQISKTVTVQNTGSCPASCDATAAPPATFSVSSDTALVGEAITFAYTGPVSASTLESARLSSAAAQSLALQVTPNPANPEIGESVRFDLSNLSGDIADAQWSFGGTGCSDLSETQTCTAGIFNDCRAMVYKYASGGSKNVSVTVHWKSGGGATASTSLTVQDTGTCGTTTTCTYAISPTNASFDAEGGDGSVSVNTQEGCTWTAVSNNPSWIALTSGETGSGPGTVGYSVGVNSGAARNGTMKVAGRTFTVNQASDSSQSTDGADAWEWTVKRGQTVVETSESPIFTTAFDDPGEYTVTLKVTNCKGSSTKTVSFTITQINDYVVPAAAHAEGQNDTTWKTDLRLFNPGTVKITVTLDFLEEARNNAGVIPGVTFDLPPKGTMVIDDVLTVIPGIPAGSTKGALRFGFDGGGGIVPVIMSRTYNDTPKGTYGQYVPAVPVLPGDGGALYLTGLADNDQYRSNLGVANLSGRDIGGLVATVLDSSGHELGSYGIGVPAYSSIQVVNVARAAGVTGNLDLFSVRLDTNGADVTAYASMIDNRTGDPVLYTPAIPTGDKVYLLGVAHLNGLNGSLWRSDVTFFNKDTRSTEVRVEYFPDQPTVFRSHLTIPLMAGSAQSFGDILTSMVSDENTKGYLVLEVTGDNAQPLVASRTYNLAEDGTYGQNVPLFSADQLIPLGGKGLLPGVSNSAVSSDGFRTNLGLLNTSETEAADVDVTIYDESGDVVGRIPAYPLEPGQYVQFDVFNAVQLGAFDMDASIEVKVTKGGPVAAYASSIDNRTGDPIFIPALVGR